ncbi:transmembrane protein 43-like [Lineus longissimus]|uniref:transmembrane protein 43-like n=1 Tax=Lineus longissimus TaxID=88925 RepID=UPI002B4CE177
MYRQNYPGDPGMHNMNMGDADSTTRVSYRNNPGFLQRISDSLMGIGVGLVLIVVACGLLYWNEGRAVYTAHSLDEGLKVVLPLKNTDTPFKENDGKLVHLNAQLKTKEHLTDNMYNVAILAVKLKREVQLYQWVEHEKRTEINEGDKTRIETTYSYSMEWKSEVVKSSSFAKPGGHHNPNSFAVESVERVAPGVRAGAFVLSKNLIDKISVFHDVRPGKTPEHPGVKVIDGGFFHGENPLQPKVGDLKVRLLYAGLTEENSEYGPPDRVSIIAKQDGAYLKEYNTHAGNDLEILYMGDLSTKEIFDREHASNNMMTWGIRFGGWVLMFIAFQCLTSLLTTLVDWVPLLRDLVAMSVLMMNVCLAISLSLTVIAIGWIRYRPLLALALLLAAATPLIISKKRASDRRSRMD